MEPGTAAPTGQGDSLLKGCSTVSVHRVSMVPFIAGTFLRRGEGSRAPIRQVVATFVAENTKHSQLVTSLP